MIADFIKLARPRDWVKNVFVFLPVPFALADGATLDPLRFGLGLGAFCLANSSVYAANDARDAERDRLHDEKRHRPVAAGRISVRAAVLFSLVLVTSSTTLSWASGNIGALIITGGYLAANLFYTLLGKNLPLVDVFLLASFFLLRVLLGCALLGVDASNWLLLCSGGLALFMGLMKRRSDVVKGLDETHRPSLMGYNESFLDQAIAITATMTIFSYALYCMQAGVLRGGREFAGLPFVLFGVLDYLRIAHVKRGGSSPVDMMLKQPTIILTGIGYLAATLWSLSF